MGAEKSEKIVYLFIYYYQKKNLLEKKNIIKWSITKRETSEVVVGVFVYAAQPVLGESAGLVVLRISLQ